MIVENGGKMSDQFSSIKPVVLLVDDNRVFLETEALIIERETGLQVHKAYNGKDAVDFVQEHSGPIIAIVDYSLVGSGIDGRDLPNHLKGVRRFPIYCIGISGVAEQRKKIEMLEAGADVFIEKLDHVDLRMAQVRAGVRVIDDVMNATWDAMTGLYSQKMFFEIVERALNSARRSEMERRVRNPVESKLHVALIYIDIDGLHHINREHGLPAGDEAINGVAEDIRNTFHRQTEICCRYGGDDFTVAITHTTKRKAGLSAQKIKETIAMRKIGIGDNKFLPLSATVVTRMLNFHESLKDQVTEISLRLSDEKEQ